MEAVALKTEAAGKELEALLVDTKAIIKRLDKETKVKELTEWPYRARAVELLKDMNGTITSGIKCWSRLIDVLQGTFYADVPGYIKRSDEAKKIRGKASRLLRTSPPRGPRISG